MLIQRGDNILGGGQLLSSFPHENASDYSFFAVTVNWSVVDKAEQGMIYGVGDKCPQCPPPPLAPLTRTNFPANSWSVVQGCQIFLKSQHQFFKKCIY